MLSKLAAQNRLKIKNCEMNIGSDPKGKLELEGPIAQWRLYSPILGISRKARAGSSVI